MHLLGPFIVAEIRTSTTVKLVQIDGMLWPRLVNGTFVGPWL
jgi:hypothetical protein